MPLANSSLSTVVHPSFGKSIPQFRRDVLTIEAEDDGTHPDGQPMDVWTPVSGLVNLSCTMADRLAWERRRREGILVRRSEGNRGYYRIDDSTVIKLCAVVCGGLAERLSEDLEALPDAAAWRGAGI